MEIYKLTAHLNNGTPSSFVFAYLPENFEGIKIAQKFSFVNPMGYTPKFSIDTMRIVSSDKVAIDTIFLQYGLESDVTIDIQELNTNGTTYGTARTFAIDFESYEIFDDFSEFALKSVSVIDTYNKIKNTEVQIELTDDSDFLPTGQKLINYVSLRMLETKFGTSGLYRYIIFEENNPSKVYDGATSLFTQIDGVDNADAYNFDTIGTPLTNQTKYSGNLKFVFSNGSAKIIYVQLYSKSSGGTISLKYNLKTVTTGSSVFTYYLDIPADVKNISASLGDSLFVSVKVTGLGGVPFTGTIDISGVFNIDFKIETQLDIVQSNNSIKYLTTENVMNTIFGTTVSTPYNENILSYGLTSANHIMKSNNFANIKPKDFLSDLCAIGGLMLNFKLDSTVEIYNGANYFNDLFAVDVDLNPINFLAITDYKDLSIRHEVELNFASVSVGQDISTYDVYTYFYDWNKILTFNQAARNASENIDLTNTKLRSDFSGILDYFYKRSQQNIKPVKDNFIFNTTFSVRVDASINSTILDVYDWFTPRDILTNWSKFLSFCFQNYGKDTLSISSNGGTIDNITIDSVAQMDDFVLSESPRLLPLSYTFTALINDVDFSEKILKLNHNDEDIYIFVTNAETTDQLREQTITGLKIQF